MYADELYDQDQLAEQQIDEPLEVKPELLLRPDYVGVVCGAQYKLENADGTTEYALAIFNGPAVSIIEMSGDDLRYLGRQIDGLLQQ
jgi:hypothetical protein